jgi:peptide-methionine (S)-S-oxide reductase
MSTFSLQAEAVFAAGSFWEAEDIFSRLRGVTLTDVGYAGGSASNPTFHDLGDHTEVVRVYYDQRIISYEELLDTFWKLHDPTSDMDDRYRSVIFYISDVQRKLANASVKRKKEDTPDITTNVEPLSRFWIAEEYHQHYLAKLRGER